MHRMSSFIILLVYHSCLPTTQVQYKKMEFGSPCPSQELVITSANECLEAARSVGFQDEFREISDMNGFPGCSYTKDSGGVEWQGRSKVQYNNVKIMKLPGNARIYAAICNIRNNKGLSLSCPADGLQTTGRHQIEGPTKLNSWEECAAKCSREKTCSYWTWVKPSGGPHARNCALMREVRGTKHESIVISGEKTCQGSSHKLNPSQDQNRRPTSKPSSPAYKPPVTSRPTYVPPPKPVDCIDFNKSITNQDQTHKNGIQKWEQCSEECRKESGCIYWTWMTKTSPRNALKCFLLVENKRQEKRQVPITREDRHAVSGKPGAIDCQPQADASHSGEGISVTTMFMVLYSIVVVVLLMAVCVYNIHSAVKRGKSS